MKGTAEEQSVTQVFWLWLAQADVIFLLLSWIIIQLNNFAALVTVWLCKYLLLVKQRWNGAGWRSAVMENVNSSAAIPKAVCIPLLQLE